MELTKPLEQFVDQLAASDFLCAICFEVPHYNSYVETDCGHFFCIKHKPNLYTECAICKGMIFDYINSKKSQRDIKRLKILCDNQMYGCAWKGDWSDLHIHLEVKCLSVPTRCRWKNCNIIESRSSIKTHEKHCKWRVIKCCYCKSKILFNSISVSGNW